MTQKLPYIKYLSALLLFGLNGIVAGHIDLSSTQIVVLRSLLGTLFLLAVFFSVLLLHEALTPARWIGAPMILGGAMLAEFVHAPAKT